MSTELDDPRLRGEKDPNNLLPDTPGAKLDHGKPDMSLLLDFGLALRGVAEVGTHGLHKYSRNGWVEVPDGINRYTAAMNRHLFREKYENLDPDSKLAHAKATAWNALARLELMERELSKKNPS